jgi:uncharacterized protein YyaL (SSP411 family)
MDRTSYADAGVVSIVKERFIPVRVDPDRRPDVSHRYSLGGWPTTAFLTPDGEILGGGTYVDRDRLPGVLRRVADAFAAGAHRRGACGTGGSVEDHAAATVDQLVRQVTGLFDPLHGGFGAGPKFPHVAPIRLVMRLCQEGASGAERDIAIKSLDAMGWGPLYDEQDGGFFRCALDADWGQPNEEKLLDVNASLLALYVEAFEAFDCARYAERAEDVLRYVQTWLADPVDGGWAASQPAGPRPAPAPGGMPVDRTLFADWNAAMVSAALQAGRVMRDTALSEFAIRSLERVVLLCYRPGDGVAHYADADGASPVRGLLDDQLAMGLAHLDAFDATGNVVYRMMAEELVLYTVRTMWDEPGGGFFDRAEDARADIGLLRERHKPFVANCTAARLLERLAQACGTESYGGLAGRTLAAIGPRAGGQGLHAADYLLALKSGTR